MLQRINDFVIRAISITAPDLPERKDDGGELGVPQRKEGAKKSWFGSAGSASVSGGSEGSGGSGASRCDDSSMLKSFSQKELSFKEEMSPLSIEKGDKIIKVRYPGDELISDIRHQFKMIHSVLKELEDVAVCCIQINMPLWSFTGDYQNVKPLEFSKISDFDNNDSANKILQTPCKQQEHHNNETPTNQHPLLDCLNLTPKSPSPSDPPNPTPPNPTLPAYLSTLHSTLQSSITTLSTLNNLSSHSSQWNTKGMFILGRDMLP